MPDVNPFSPASDSEKKFLAKLVRPDVTIDLVIPDKVDSEQYWDTLAAVCHQISQSMSRTQILLPALGRLLLLAKQDPENTYKAKGIKSQEKFFEQIEKQYGVRDRKSTRLNSSHVRISYAVFCL